MAIFRNLYVRLIQPQAGLKILQCILAVKIFAFLDLAKNLSFSDKLLAPKPTNNPASRGISATIPADKPAPLRPVTSNK